MLKSRTNHTFT